SEDRAVDDHRAVLRVILAYVREIEELGVLIVELDGAELPAAADRVLDVEVDLRTVERAVALLQLVVESDRLERIAQYRLRTVPEGVIAYALLRARRELHAVAQTERVVEVVDHFDQATHFLDDLRLHQVDVRVVLLELPHARETRQRTAHFVAVQHVLRRVAHGQLAVAASPG